MLSFCGFGTSSRVTSQGPNGANVSALLPLVQQLCAKRCHPGLELAKSLPRGKRRQDGLTLLSRLVATGACYFGRDLA